MANQYTPKPVKEAPVNNTKIRRTILEQEIYYVYVGFSKLIDIELPNFITKMVVNSGEKTLNETPNNFCHASLFLGINSQNEDGIIMEYGVYMPGSGCMDIEK